jgi:hypothetical protein
MKLSALLLPAGLVGLIGFAPANAGMYEPSGVWIGKDGTLALMRAGDSLAFSYTSVFGAAAHMCDGIGVARRVGPGRWEYVDDQGKVSFTGNEGVSLHATDGIASFCGAYWPGERFHASARKPPFYCSVTVSKAFFHNVETLPPKARKSYLIKGDKVEALTLVNESSVAWLLVRHQGKKQATVGLIERDALDCGDH